MQKDDIVQGTIESLAFGGQGLLKTNGLVVFIPFTAPGDLIECQLTKVKKNFAEAKLLRLIQPSPIRAEPLCPYYGICGGCQLQHLPISSQLAYKQKAVVDSLLRIGKISLHTAPSITPAQEIWAYRRHITLSLAPQSTSYTAGYTAVDGATQIPIKQCPIFLEKDHPLFNELDFIVKRLESCETNPGRVTVLKEANQSFLLYFRFQHLPRNCRAVFDAARNRWPQWSGIIAASPQKTISCGVRQTKIEVEGLQLTFSPTVFMQNHAEQSLNIYRNIVRLAEGSPRIIDLYCGIGVSSLLLAKKGSEVLGIESNRDAVALASSNAQDNGIKNAKFIASDVKKGLKKWLHEHKPQVMVVNPPRGGLEAAVVEAIKQQPVEKLLYISCMPPTLARDIGFLCEKTYRVQSCHLYDMFPQTSHVETLVELIRQKH